MKYTNLQTASEQDFRRATGVKRATFYVMLDALKRAEQLKKVRGGRPNKLSLENRLLMALEYLREYRTYLSISITYGISESNTFETVKWVEDTLIKSGLFNLPGKKALVKSDIEYEVILIDATECPIQRPKKNSADSSLEKRSVTL